MLFIFLILFTFSFINTGFYRIYTTTTTNKTQMYTNTTVQQMCHEHNVTLISIDSNKQTYSRDTKVTIQCSVHDCEETVSKSLRNLFTNKNFGCKVHCKKFKGEKIKKTKGDMNLGVACENDTGKRYTYEQLSIMECRPSLFSICHELKIAQYHNLPRTALISAILERQHELDEMKGVEESKEEIVPREL